MKCYFCNKSLLEDIDPVIRRGLDNWPCDSCAKSNSLNLVISSYNKMNELIYVHIYAYNKHREYHIRLHIKENKTIIQSCITYQVIMELDKFPINPSNANARLATCMTFL